VEQVTLKLFGRVGKSEDMLAYHCCFEKSTW